MYWLASVQFIIFFLSPIDAEMSATFSAETKRTIVVLQWIYVQHFKKWTFHLNWCTCCSFGMRWPTKTKRREYQTIKERRNEREKNVKSFGIRASADGNQRMNLLAHSTSLVVYIVLSFGSHHGNTKWERKRIFIRKQCSLCSVHLARANAHVCVCVCVCAYLDLQCSRCCVYIFIGQNTV